MKLPNLEEIVRLLEKSLVTGITLFALSCSGDSQNADSYSDSGSLPGSTEKNNSAPSYADAGINNTPGWWHPCSLPKNEDCVPDKALWQQVHDNETETEDHPFLTPNRQFELQGCYISNPSFSPDGRNILYTSHCNYELRKGLNWGVDSLFITHVRKVNIETGERQTILEPQFTEERFYRFYCARWSPSGEYIAVTGDRPLEHMLVDTELALLRSDGTEFRIIAGRRQSAADSALYGPDMLSCPSWSQDGKELVIRRAYGLDRQQRIEKYSLSQNSSSRQVLLESREAKIPFIEDVEWGSDGFVYFNSYYPYCNQLYALNPLNGTEIYAFGEEPNLNLLPDFTISNDSRRLLWYTSPYGRCNSFFDICAKEVSEIHLEGPLCTMSDLSWHPFRNQIVGLNEEGELGIYHLPCSLLEQQKDTKDYPIE